MWEGGVKLPPPTRLGLIQFQQLYKFDSEICLVKLDTTGLKNNIGNDFFVTKFYS